MAPLFDLLGQGKCYCQGSGWDSGCEVQRLGFRINKTAREARTVSLLYFNRAA
jgi:hypothetical protein